MKKVQRNKNMKPLVRAVGVMAAIMIVVAGVTFAALQSQQVTITGSSIETGTAGLQLSLDNSHLSSSLPGFTFKNIVPGQIQSEESGTFYLENTGNVNLKLKLAVSSTLTNPQGVDLSQVTVTLAPRDSSSPPLTFSLQSLVDADTTGGLPIDEPMPLDAGNFHGYTMYVSMASGATNATFANIGNIDFTFSGVAE